MHTDRYRLTLAYHPNTDKATSGLVKRPFTYHDLEDASEQQPLTSTMEVKEPELANTRRTGIKLSTEDRLREIEIGTWSLV